MWEIKKFIRKQHKLKLGLIIYKGDRGSSKQPWCLIQVKFHPLDSRLVFSWKTVPACPAKLVLLMKRVSKLARMHELAASLVTFQVSIDCKNSDVLCMWWSSHKNHLISNRNVFNDFHFREAKLLIYEEDCPRKIAKKQTVRWKELGIFHFNFKISWKNRA